MRRTLKRLALILGRTSEDAKTLGDAQSNRAKILLFASVLAAFSALYAPSLWRAFGPTHPSEPQVLLPSKLWHLVYDSPAQACPYDASHTRADCLANPHNPTLWQSPHLRTDADKSALVNKRVGKEFWMGAEIPVSVLAEAHRLQANRLILGWINATYRIWLDGRYLTGTDGWHEAEPITLMLPMARLGEPRPLRLAIQIIHDTGRDDPDFFNKRLGGEGFATTLRLNDFKAVSGMYTRGRPFSLFLAYGLLGVAFFVFWLPARTKSEYFYIALHALTAAFVNLQTMDLYWSAVSPALNGFTKVTLEFYLPAFGMFLGFAFGRSRRAFFRIGIPIALLAPVLAITAAPDPESMQLMQNVIRGYLTPAGYAIGALACLIQRFNSSVLSNAALQVRRQRLGLFGVGLGGLALLYAVAYHTHWTGSLLAWLGIEHLGILLYFGVIALREYREQATRAQRTPVSEYHRREVLPERLSGALLVADFKAPPGSHLRQRTSQNENATTVWRSHFFISIMKAGGVVVHHKGEELIAFFDTDRCSSPVRTALAVLEEVEAASKLMDIEFSRSRQAFCFRASIVRGDIKPIWETLGDQREPYWEEAGDTTPFVESSRLLELEREALSQEQSDSLGSLVLLQESLALELVAQAPQLSSSFHTRAAPAKDKHGQAYSIAVYRPGDVAAAPAQSKTAA